MEYSIAALPTTYRRIVFRSRLEAQWAAMLDRLAWDWEYEPFPLGDDGLYWLPDFAICGRNRDPVFAEVKPTFKPVPELFARISRAAPRSDLLVLGIAPFVHDGAPAIGWCNEPTVGQPGGPGAIFAPAVLGIWRGTESTTANPGGMVGYCSSSMFFTDRITGCYDGGCYGSATPYDFPHEIEARWADAKTATRYEPTNGGSSA
jgi:hypothetical protein